MRLVEIVRSKNTSEDIAPEMIDKAALKFGMPMGPIELVDTVGMNVCNSVATILSGGETLELPTKMANMVDKGNSGKKNRRKFL